jgi:hypothetical protein
MLPIAGAKLQAAEVPLKQASLFRQRYSVSQMQSFSVG